MISSVVLTHNSEETIARTLVSLSWSDEIIIIDDYSDDRTCEIARKYTPHIHQRHLADDFASQRNFALTKTTGDWILFVDSDEVISEELAREIQEVIASPGAVAGYLFTRQDWLWGRALRYGETSHVRLLRLARKNAGKWTRSVHEIWDIGGPVKLMRHPLQHFPHRDVAQFITKINRYSTIAAHDLYVKKQKTHLPELIGKPALKFLLNYFFRLGFLDGTAGAIMAIMMSMHSFLVRGKLFLLWHPGRKS